MKPAFSISCAYLCSELQSRVVLPLPSSARLKKVPVAAYCCRDSRHPKKRFDLKQLRDSVRQI